MSEYIAGDTWTEYYETVLKDLPGPEEKERRSDGMPKLTYLNHSREQQLEFNYDEVETYHSDEEDEPVQPRRLTYDQKTLDLLEGTADIYKVMDASNSGARKTVDWNAIIERTSDKKDENDPSLQRYKASLGVGEGKTLSDPNDPRTCIILSLEMNVAGRDPVIIDLTEKTALENLKKNPFKLKEGVKFNMTATFRVQHNIISGLCYVHIIKRMGVKVAKDQEMIGSYSPNTEDKPVHTKKFAEETAPSGMMGRGKYAVHSSFVDDDKVTHLTFEWSFDISKDW